MPLPSGSPGDLHNTLFSTLRAQSGFVPRIERIIFSNPVSLRYRLAFSVTVKAELPDRSSINSLICLLLIQCAERCAKIEAGLERCDQAIADLTRELNKLEPAYERECRRNRLVARLALVRILVAVLASFALFA
jgi:hypothetical protein